MKRIAIALAGLALLGPPLVQTGHAEVNVNVNVGLPPLPAPPQIVIAEPPEFILPPALGFYVAVGIPQDIFLVGNTYYLYNDRGWYEGRHFNGPWRYTERRQLPPGLRKHKFERIRHYRDEEYRRYRVDHNNYRGKRFKPEKEWKEERKQDRREDKAQRKDEKRYDKEQRKDDRRYEKEERKQDKHEGRGQGKHGGSDD